MKIYSDTQVSVKGLYTQEANEEARKMMTSKSHILSINGENMRVIAHESIQTLYSMTRFEK